ncbi:MAG: protein phosphatase 2C domain-containing protein [Acidobacteria bacterium]|nr:protein phosphatase 2C domain-containing protein [Acidobacteriota bacterium]
MQTQIGTASFEIGYGSVIGRDHTAVSKNCQDAWHCAGNETVLVAVVCDGCGSGKHSEVGAKLGARFLTQEILNQSTAQDAEILSTLIVSTEFWHTVREATLKQLQAVASALGGSLAQVVSDYLLFTVVGVVVTPLKTVVFSLGDGVYTINGDVKTIGPFPDNMPPYLAYGLVNSSLATSNPDRLHFSIEAVRPTAEVQSVLIATDGLEEVLRSTTCKLPGKSDVVGSLSQFWEADHYFSNPDAIRRKLSLMNVESRRPDWENRRMLKEPGLLSDDTTLVVIRKKSE